MLNNRLFKEPNKINFPNDNEIPTKKISIYELLLQTEGDYKKVSQILDQKIFETNQLIKDLTENIKHLPNELFEEKLNKLKNDNLETMLLCDEFRKIASRKEKEQENFDLRNYDNEKPFVNENSKKLSQKPPQIPKFNKIPQNFMKNDGNNHHDSYLDDLDDVRSLDSFGNVNYGNFQKLWKEYGDIDDEDEINKREQNYKREAAMDRLTRSKSSLSKYQDESEKSHNTFDPDYLVAKWRHKVTVPQPFEMTVREESKRKFQKSLDDNKLRKSRTLLEFQVEMADKEKQELEETKKQFKANPVPAHVYIPLYETMQEESNQRRQFLREYNKEILKSIEKPFNFYKREIEKQKQKAELAYSATDSSKSISKNNKTTSKKQPLKSYHSERQKTIIRAKEAPKYSNSSSTMEKLKEDELFRLIKAEMRSKQLLEDSKMPGNMAERQKIQEEKRKQRELKNASISLRKRSKSADSSKNNKDIPNFSKIHKDWEEEIRMSYKEPYITQTKPFNLSTEQRNYQKSTNDLENMIQNQYNTTYNNSVTKSEWNKSILAALEIAKPSTNKSTMLREMAVKTKLLEEEKKMHSKAIEQLARKKREMDASEKIRKSLDLDGIPKGEDKRRQKTKELKVENELRKENYQRELEEIKKKVEQKPLLLETAVNKNKTINNHTKVNEDGQKFPKKKSGIYNNYDERYNFGDPISHRSSTDASGSIEDVHSYQKSNHSKLFKDDDEFSQTNYGHNNHSNQY